MFFDDEDAQKIQEILSALHHKEDICLQGELGVGKTTLSETIARHLSDTNEYPKGIY